MKSQRKVYRHEKILSENRGASQSILTLFILAAVFSLFCQRLVRVNYDIKDYLPEKSPSTIALDKMEEEYEGGIPNARVMIRDTSVAEALEYKEKLEGCPGSSV